MRKNTDLATLTPPRRLVDQPGTGDWRHLGSKWLATFQMWGGLRPSDDVLDVGCGAGRMALALAGFTTGRYEGFDVDRKAVAWCQREISPRWPAARFEWVDLANPSYNRRGGDAAGFTFPYPDVSFDFVFATSVFTHMMQAEVAHYITEVARVRRPGGRFLASWFTIGPDTRASIAAGAARFAFQHPQGSDGYVQDVRHPAAAVAYNDSWVKRVLRDAGFADCTFHPGSWSGEHPDARHGQDVTVAS